MATTTEHYDVHLRDGTSIHDLIDEHGGHVSRRIFADPEVFALEQERIFGRAWFFVGHESEIPNPGDVLTRQCGLDPVLFLRDQDGEVRVFLNSCRHRGMRLSAATDRDNLRLFCAARTTAGVTARTASCLPRPRASLRDGELDKTQLGLIPVARLGIVPRARLRHLGRARAPSLEDWLGDMRWYMDIIFGRTGEIEVSACRRSGKSNARGNSRPTISPTTSTCSTRTRASSSSECCRPIRTSPRTATWSRCRTATSCTSCPGPPDRAFQGLGLPPELRPSSSISNLNPAQARIAHAPWLQRGHDVAEFSLAAAHDRGRHRRPDGPIGILNLRLESPDAATRISSYLVPSTRTPRPTTARLSYETYVRTFGPGRHLRPGRHGELGGVHPRELRQDRAGLQPPPRDGPPPGSRSGLPQGRARRTPGRTASARSSRSTASGSAG